MDHRVVPCVQTGGQHADVATVLSAANPETTGRLDLTSTTIVHGNHHHMFTMAMFSQLPDW